MKTSATSWPQLESYANAMFMFERPHNSWIVMCAEYVSKIFGERIRDAVVIDYGFGRGNWALAFRRAGARKVIAVDASISNVERFGRYCSSNGIDGIDVIHGNAVDEPLDLEADIIWLYGVLHHVPSADALLARLVECLRDDKSELMVYAYESGSLRHAVVEAVRLAVTYRTTQEFLEDALKFIPVARLRARDDLTAPFIRWYREEELQEQLRRAGIGRVRAVASFDEALGRGESREFQPFHFLCRQSSVSDGEIVTGSRSRVEFDAGVIGGFAREIITRAGARRDEVAIGLFNSHFSGLASGGFPKAIMDDFLYLLFAGKILAIELEKLGGELSIFCKLGMAALEDVPRALREDLRQHSELARFLAFNTIRL